MTVKKLTEPRQPLPKPVQSQTVRAAVYEATDKYTREQEQIARQAAANIEARQRGVREADAQRQREQRAEATMIDRSAPLREAFSDLLGDADQAADAAAGQYRSQRKLYCGSSRKYRGAVIRTRSESRS